MKVRRWWRAKGDFEREMDEELRGHIQERADDLERGGMPRAEAERRARIEFGGYQKFKEECRETRGMAWLHSLAQDIRFGVRMLRKSPGFTAVAVLTLALGIGANTAIFSLVNCLVFRPLPIDRPGQVVFLEAGSKGAGPQTTFSYPDFQQIQRQTSGIFSEISALQMSKMDGLSVDGKAQPIWSNYISENFFTVLGLKPALGRFFLPSEGRTIGADPVMIISYSCWKSHFNAEPDVIGKKVSLNGHPLTVAGVAPEGFRGLEAFLGVEGYIPLAMAPTLQDASATFLTDRTDTRLALIARLKAGVTLQQAQPALGVVAQRLSETNRVATSIRALPLGPTSLTLGPSMQPRLDLVSSLFLILAGALLVLACMNIAHLFLIRVAARQREVAMRAALGATRMRLMRQLLTESLLLATLGCVAGIIIGMVASRSLASISFHTDIPILLDFHFDWRVFAYALIAAALTGILVGITPAFRVSRIDLSEMLRDGGRTSTGGRQRLRGTLVVAQVAGSLMVLTVAGLFVRSLEKVQHTDLGFDPAHVLNATIDPHEAGYQDAQAREFQKTLLIRARALPGVASAAVALAVPMGYSGYYDELKIDGYQTRPGDRPPTAGFNAVTSDYFQTMRIPLLQGRGVQDSDDRDSERVAIVNRNFVDRYWHGLNPIGRRFFIASDLGHPIEVVGVAGNSRDNDMFTSNDPFFYVPFVQGYDSSSFMTLQLRAVSAPETLAPEVTGLVRSLDPAMPVFDVQPMTATLDSINGFLLFQLAAALAGALGILGLVLALVGVYGVISYAASQRTHEVGIRIALGAQPAQVLALIFQQGFLIVGIGVATGILGAIAMARLVSGFLFGISPIDGLTYIGTSAMVAVIALVACWIPARRAMRVDPMVALRHE